MAADGVRSDGFAAPLDKHDFQPSFVRRAIASKRARAKKLAVGAPFMGVAGGHKDRRYGEFRGFVMKTRLPCSFVAHSSNPGENDLLALIA